MLKIPRNFCRFCALINYYSFSINKDIGVDIDTNTNLLEQGFYNILNTSINYSLKFYKLLTTFIEEYSDSNLIKRMLSKDSEFLALIKSDIFNQCIKHFRVDYDKNFDTIESLFTELERKNTQTYDVKNVLKTMAEDNNFAEVLDITDIFYTKAMQNIFNQINTNFSEDMLKSLLIVEKANTKNNKFYKDLVLYSIKDEIETMNEVGKIAENWKENRIGLIEKIIICLGIAEYKHLGTPIQVVINEYVDLVKLFVNVDAGAFVNGILDKLIKGTYYIKKN